MSLVGRAVGQIVSSLFAFCWRQNELVSSIFLCGNFIALILASGGNNKENYMSEQREERQYLPPGVQDLVTITTGPGIDAAGTGVATFSPLTLRSLLGLG